MFREGVSFEICVGLSERFYEASSFKLGEGFINGVRHDVDTEGGIIVEDLLEYGVAVTGLLG